MIAGMSREQRSFCRICLATCGIVVTLDGDDVVAVRGDPTDPVSQGYVCAKGRGLADVHGQGRLDGARVRSGKVVRTTTIEDGLDDAAMRLRTVLDEHGPGSVATFLGSGGFSDPMGSWAAGRLRQALGITQTYSTSTVDAVSKVLTSHLMAGTGSLIPHPDADTRLLLLVGSNPVVSHGQSTPFANPIERIRAARANGEVWVVDPRRSETAALADHHVAARPGTDYAVTAHLVRAVFAAGVDRALVAERADGIDELADAVAPFDRVRASSLTGIDPTQLDDLATAVLRAGRVAVVTGTGTTMARAAYLTEWLAWALMVLTDSFDQPGGMWFNPGFHLRLDRRRPLRELSIGAGPPSHPTIGSVFGEWPAALIPEEIEAGRLRALIVVGGDPATALPDTDRLHRALRDLDVLIATDIVQNETTAAATHAFGCADQLERPDLPSLDLFSSVLATRWTDAVVAPVPERPEMWRVFAKLAARLGHDLLESGEDADTLSTEALTRRVKPAVDIDAIRDAGGVIVEAPAVYGWVQEHMPWGRWRLAPEPFVERLVSAPPPPPLVLAPRRQGRRMNGLAYRDGDAPEAVLHPRDAAPHHIGDGDEIEVSTPAGRLQLRARVTDTIAVGTVSIPHGWGTTNVNTLISSADLDPLTGMPVLSGTAVEVRALQETGTPA
jgi:anaerobic selenocysteine-containing dehydrogenase